MIEQALNQYLRGRPGLSALVADRVYPLLLPENVKMPAVVTAVAQRTEQPDLSGSGPSRVRLQLYSWGETYQSVKATAGEIRVALHGYRGDMGGAGGVYVLYAGIESEQDGYNAEVKLFYVLLDVAILYRGE